MAAGLLSACSTCARRSTSETSLANGNTSVACAAIAVASGSNLRAERFDDVKAISLWKENERALVPAYLYIEALKDFARRDPRDSTDRRQRLRTLDPLAQKTTS
jgi:hypothetical protein